MIEDITYLLEVLNIGDGTTEDQLDERLRSEAKELGVDVEEQQEAVQQEQQSGEHGDAYTTDCPRRSDSVDSRTSKSTGLFSNSSDMSKDPWGRRRSRASLSFRDYDAFIARGVPTGRHSLQFSPLTTPSHSTFSLPLSQPPSPDQPSPRKAFRRIKGLSMLRLHARTGSDASLGEGCPHCPQDIISQRRAVHKLPCGHRLCTQALRNTVRSATESKTGAVPSCCGKPIPGSLVEHVMTQEEQTALLDKLEQWDEAVSIAPSMDSSRRDSVPAYQPPPRPTLLTAHSRTVSDESRFLNLAPKERKDLDKILSREDYQLILTGQGDQRDRFLRWATKQLSAIDSIHERLREEMRRRHETSIEDLVERHNLAMADAEDKQVKAEADMRETQHQERRDSATALKHMEFYCSGVFSTGEAHNRTITASELLELEKARHNRSQLESKHEAQINVLRGEQSRRMRLRAQRQDREVHELKKQQRKEELELERTCTSERVLLDSNVAAKQKKVQWRWELQMAIFAKKVETETGVRVGCRLPTARWTNDEKPLPKVAAESKAGISTGFAMRGAEFNGGFRIGAC